MVKINLYVTKRQLEALKELSQNGLTMAEHIRRAIDLYLAHLKKGI